MTWIEDFFIHWKTTLFGLAAAALIQLQQGTSYKTVALSFAIALLGAFAKDGNKQ
jgi:hypothetical protein